MPCTTHASMHSAPLRKKSDALRSSARSGYLMRRLQHAVSRPCDAICAVLEPSPVLSLVRCGRCCSHVSDSAMSCTSIIERPAPQMRRHSPRPGCGGCSVGGKPGRCLRVRRPLPLCFSQRPQHRPRRRRLRDSLSPWSASTAGVASKPERADPSASDAARQPGAPERPLHWCTERRAAFEAISPVDLSLGWRGLL